MFLQRCADVTKSPGREDNYCHFAEDPLATQTPWAVIMCDYLVNYTSSDTWKAIHWTIKTGNVDAFHNTEKFSPEETEYVERKQKDSVWLLFDVCKWIWVLNPVKYWKQKLFNWWITLPGWHIRKSYMHPSSQLIYSSLGGHLSAKGIKTNLVLLHQEIFVSNVVFSFFFF